MDYEEYVAQTEKAAEFDEAGEYEKAVEIFRRLLASDISDLDKSIMCHNIGVVLEKMGREQEALSSYEQGMSYERPHGRNLLAEARAAYLHRLGRNAESLRAYEELSHHPSLTEVERYRMRHNIAALRELVR